MACLTASLITGLFAEAVPIGFISLRCSLRKLLGDLVGICVAFRGLSAWPLNFPHPIDALNSVHVYAFQTDSPVFDGTFSPIVTFCPVPLHGSLSSSSTNPSV